MADILPHLLDRCDEAVLAAEGFLASAKHGVRARMGTTGGEIAAHALDGHQRAAHALAWHATYVEARARRGGGGGWRKGRAASAISKSSFCRPLSANI